MNMIYWLVVIIIAYLFFSLSSLGDKLVLSGKPKPVSYTFYVGIFSILVVVLIPFTKFTWPSNTSLMWIILDALVHTIGIYTMFVALRKFEVSKVMTTIGATQPIFILILTWIFWGPQAMPIIDIVAFIILFLASVLISLEKNVKVTGDYLKITVFSSLMFSLDYVFSKFVFLNAGFLEGIIWIRLFVIFLVLFFLVSKKWRQEIFAKQMVLDKKTQITFIATQACGGAANFLQSLAIALAPIAFLPIVNSLRGIQYVFLFLATLSISYFAPKILREGVTKKIIFQKVFAIVLIVIGLAMLSF
jgi:hypothetical protein